LEDIKIKYDKLGIIGVTIGLGILSYLFYTVLSKTSINSLGSAVSIIPGLCLMLGWYSWIELFLIPFILGKPAIVISKEGLLVNSIGVLIPWDHIKEVDIIEDRYGFSIKIFSIEDSEKIERSSSPSKWLLLLINDFAHNTPFIFKTIFIQGKAHNIFYIIRNAKPN
jgi:hypothetical protein